MKKRILSAIVAIAMCFSFINVVSFADEEAANSTFKNRADLETLMNKFPNSFMTGDLLDYGTESQDAFRKAKNFADFAHDSGEADEDIYNAAYFMLVAAEQNLSKKTYSELRSLMSTTRTVFNTDNVLNNMGDQTYTDSTWNDFSDAFMVAEDIRSDADSANISDAWVNLNKAYEDLEKRMEVTTQQFNAEIRKVTNHLKNRYKYTDERRGTSAGIGTLYAWPLTWGALWYNGRNSASLYPSHTGGTTAALATQNKPGEGEGAIPHCPHRYEEEIESYRGHCNPSPRAGEGGSSEWTGGSNGGEWYGLPFAAWGYNEDQYGDITDYTSFLPFASYSINSKTTNDAIVSAYTQMQCWNNAITGFKPDNTEFSNLNTAARNLTTLLNKHQRAIDSGFSTQGDALTAIDANANMVLSNDSPTNATINSKQLYDAILTIPRDNNSFTVSAVEAWLEGQLTSYTWRTGNGSAQPTLSAGALASQYYRAAFYILESANRTRALTTATQVDSLVNTANNLLKTEVSWTLGMLDGNGLRGDSDDSYIRHDLMNSLRIWVRNTTAPVTATPSNILVGAPGDADTNGGLPTSVVQINYQRVNWQTGLTEAGFVGPASGGRMNHNFANGVSGAVSNDIQKYMWMRHNNYRFMRSYAGPRTRPEALQSAVRQFNYEMAAFPVAIWKSMPTNDRDTAFELMRITAKNGVAESELIAFALALIKDDSENIWDGDHLEELGRIGNRDWTGEDVLEAYNKLAAASASEIADLEAAAELGDVNGDGDVTTADALLILQYVVGLAELDEDQLKAADVNGDGAVTTADALEILKFVVGMASALD